MMYGVQVKHGDDRYCGRDSWTEICEFQTHEEAAETRRRKQCEALKAEFAEGGAQ